MDAVSSVESIARQDAMLTLWSEQFAQPALPIQSVLNSAKEGHVRSSLLRDAEVGAGTDHLQRRAAALTYTLSYRRCLNGDLFRSWLGMPTHEPRPIETSSQQSPDHIISTGADCTVMVH
ncbi:MAG: hypothetical protein EOP50_21990 [Sphingobacteriales bacterium]|nr:MAG: hypothetical protein EOP50_21990 [Sphingobacteriales bacterium]